MAKSVKPSELTRDLSTSAATGYERVDRFGITYSQSLIGESLEDRERREQVVLQKMALVFEMAVDHLGPKHARLEWKRIAKGRRGTIRGLRTSKGEQDRLLLEIYDQVMLPSGEPGPDRSKPKKVPLDLARRLHQHYPKEYGSDPANIARRLKKLLNIRDAQTSNPTDLSSRENGSLIGAARAND